MISPYMYFPYITVHSIYGFDLLRHLSKQSRVVYSRPQRWQYHGFSEGLWQLTWANCLLLMYLLLHSQPWSLLHVKLTQTQTCLLKIRNRILALFGVCYIHYWYKQMPFFIPPFVVERWAELFLDWQILQGHALPWMSNRCRENETTCKSTCFLIGNSTQQLNNKAKSGSWNASPDELLNT